jgi:hypothetical protein
MPRRSCAAVLRTVAQSGVPLILLLWASQLLTGLAHQAGSILQDLRTVATLTGTLRVAGSSNLLDDMPIALTSLSRVVTYRTKTDAAGRFAFDAIRPGQYYVVIPRDGYIVELGRVALRAGETIDRMYAKGVELAGSVTDERGAAVFGTTVCALRRENPGPAVPARYRPVMWSLTDARGRFVLGSGVEASAGAYIVAAMPTGCDMAVREVSERIASYPPVYAPGVLEPEDAVEIVVDARSSPAVAIRLRAGPVTRLDGRLIGYSNTTVTPGLLILEPADAAVSIVRTTKISSDGRFAFQGLSAGSYRLVLIPKLGPDPLRWAIQPITLAGEPVRRLIVPTHPTMAMGGQIDFAGHLSMLYGTRVFLTVNATRVGDRWRGLAPSTWSAVLPDGKFAIAGLMPGEYTLSVSGAEPWNWYTKSAIYSGPPGQDARFSPLDLFDAPVTIEAGKSIFGLVIQMTYLRTAVTGTIEGDKNQPVAGATAIVFSPDPRYWGAGSRRIRTAVADANGAFSITGLPAGEYLAAATATIVRFPRLPDARILESLRALAVPFSLSDGGSKEMVLKLPGRAPFNPRPGLNN